jgi:hypothetical protein
MDTIAATPGWSVQDGASDHTAPEIEPLVGADADAIRAYGLRGALQFVAAQTDSANGIEVTLFEMLDSAAAFGLFALQRNWKTADFAPAVIGIESYRQNNRLVVWQSNYVANLTGPSEVADELGTLLADNIFGSSRKAPVSTLLPREDLIQDSEKYILTAEAFKEATGLDPAQLGFADSAEAAVAEYASANGAMTRLAMILYPTQHLASLHLDTWTAERDVAYSERRTGPLLGIVLDTNDDRLSTNVLDALRYQSEVTWNELPRDALTLPYMILTIFTWIGIALGFILTVGLGYGAIRIYMKTRYPERFMGVSPNAELIQLNINQQVTRKQLDS